MIKIDDYIITISKYSHKYILKRSKGEIKTGKYKGTSIVSDIAYDVSLQKAISLIIQDKLRREESVDDLNSFLEKYNQISNETLASLEAEVNRINNK